LKRSKKDSGVTDFTMLKLKSDGDIIKKTIDKEHVTIEKIFRITIDPEATNGFFYLEQYHAVLMSINDESQMKFRISNLHCMLIEYIFLHEDVLPNILNYLLVSYHRAVIMIERKYYY